ncbi:Hypothetical predicted protein [Cloeon dipterum]|uniref:Serine/arginine repetitive matrix protein C-terminal domain-containing protein n=1 Tax=Cloeon dipterum TaxID=197152 RepID=A0A8S1C5P2_9INSE|nr:Hypothetical predicted protein [Cloeon dipterum]
MDKPKRKRNRRRRGGGAGRLCQANNCWTNGDRALFERLWKGTFQAILSEQQDGGSASSFRPAINQFRAKCCSCCCHGHAPPLGLYVNTTKNTFSSSVRSTQSHIAPPLSLARSVSETQAEVQKREVFVETMGTSEAIGSSNSSNKTSPSTFVDAVDHNALVLPIKSKKRKRKSRDSSVSSERRRKYSKKSKKRSSSDTREKSHKKAKRDKEKHGSKRSSSKKDLKQKKGSDSDSWRKKSKKRSSRKRRRSRDDGKSKDSPSVRTDEKSNGEGRQKKKKRSKERKRKRSKEKSRRKGSRSERRRSDSSRKSNSSGGEQNSCSPKLVSKGEEAEKNEVQLVTISDSHVVPLNVIKLNYSSENDNIDDLPEKMEIPLPAEEAVDRGKRVETVRKGKVPEIAPFRIEPKNNPLRPLEKLARPFLSPFKKLPIEVKTLSFVPKPSEIEPAIETAKPAPILVPDEDEKTLDVVKAAVEETQQPEVRKEAEQWSSSASSSSRSSRAGSVCSTCSSDGSGKYDSRYSKRRYTSGSPSSRSSSSSHRSRSRSPSIPRRRGSPSFLERRRITSARKRPIPYHRSSPMSSSSESRRYSDNGYSSSDNDDSRSSSYSGKSWSRSRSRSASPDYSCYP